MRYLITLLLVFSCSVGAQDRFDLNNPIDRAKFHEADLMIQTYWLGYCNIQYILNNDIESSDRIDVIVPTLLYHHTHDIANTYKAADVDENLTNILERLIGAYEEGVSSDSQKSNIACDSFLEQLENVLENN